MAIPFDEIQRSTRSRDRICEKLKHARNDIVLARINVRDALTACPFLTCEDEVDSTIEALQSLLVQLEKLESAGLVSIIKRLREKRGS